MVQKTRLAIFDLDGTLFDTKRVNYSAYNSALKECGFNVTIDYKFYCDFCNGNSYKVFLPYIVPQITTDQIQIIHEKKKIWYAQYLDKASINKHMFCIMDMIRSKYKIALVTTASFRNTQEILEKYKVSEKFDFILTQEDVKETKPSPECFLKAMKIACVEAENTLIFEDSITGIKAAQKSGAQYMQVYGFN